MSELAIVFIIYVILSLEFPSRFRVTSRHNSGYLDRLPCLSEDVSYIGDDMGVFWWYLRGCGNETPIASG